MTWIWTSLEQIIFKGLQSEELGQLAAWWFHPAHGVGCSIQPLPGLLPDPCEACSLGFFRAGRTDRGCIRGCLGSKKTQDG